MLALSHRMVAPPVPRGPVITNGFFGRAPAISAQPCVRRSARQSRQGAVAFKETPTNVKDHPALKNLNPRLYINGEFVDGSSGETFDVLDPRTEEVICKCALANADDVDRAVKAARAAFEGPWSQIGGAARGRLMNKLADLIEENIDELAGLESLDNGKPFKIARGVDIPAVIAHFRYFAGWADKNHGKTIPCDPAVAGPMQAFTYHEPIGVCGQISPWNFTALMPTRKIAPSMACGCVSVLKVAEQTPLTGLRIAELATEAGFPPGVLNVLTGPGESGAALVAHPDVDKISFTGSTAVGKIILKSAADTVKNVTMELGGKNPLIIWKDVDFDKAVENAHSALFYNSGQCCAAGSRVYVHSSIYDKFVEASTKLAAKKVVGDPFDDKTEQGPQVDSDQMHSILNYIKLGKEQGAQLHTGGSRIGDKGYYIEPTVFSNVTDDMTIAKEEIFGPVQCIMKFDDIDDVIKRANTNDYGLAAGIFAKDIDIVNKAQRGLKAGTVWVNCWNVYDSAVPFGGYKQSGIGRDKGQDALTNYTQVKAVYQPLKGPAWM